MKKIACLLCVIFIVFACSIPCFADSWGSSHPIASQYLYIPFNSYTDSIFPSTTHYGLYSNIYEDILTIVDNAYELGMFGGAIPIYVTLNENTSHANTPITVYFTSPIRPEEGVSKYEGLRVVVDSNNRVQVRYYKDTGGYSEPYVIGWQMTNTGEFGINSASYSQLVQLSTSGRKLLAVKNESGEWETGFSYTTSDYYIEVFGMEGRSNQDLIDIISAQEEALAQTVINNPQYELNIGEIITAIPNGAKQIINSAFDIEIFGINVAGLLSTLIVVLIISFVIKWLTSR